MKKHQGIAKELEKNLILEKRPDQVNISYSQFSYYEECPYKWYLTYAKKMRLFNASIHSIFGTSIHEAIQKYVNIIFESSAKQADEYDIVEFFETRLKEEYIKERESNGGTHFSDKEEMNSFYQDGVNILGEIKKKRKEMVSSRYHELLGIEIPLYTPIKTDTDVFVFNAYIDLVYRDKRDNTVYIEDIKTSTKGWSKYEKTNDIKLSQLLFYKHFFAKQFSIDIDTITPRYRIVKRKLWENLEYPQSRIQVFEPANGKIKVNAALQKLNVFIDNCYDSSGNVIEKEYDKKPSPNNCKFCPFRDRPDLCDKNLP